MGERSLLKDGQGDSAAVTWYPGYAGRGEPSAMVRQHVINKRKLGKEGLFKEHKRWSWHLFLLDSAHEGQVFQWDLKGSVKFLEDSISGS